MSQVYRTHESEGHSEVMAALGGTVVLTMKYGIVVAKEIDRQVHTTDQLNQIWLKGLESTMIG